MTPPRLSNHLDLFPGSCQPRKALLSERSRAGAEGEPVAAHGAAS